MLQSRINKMNLVSEYEFRVKRNPYGTAEDTRERAIKDIMWDTMGPGNAKLRQELMIMFTGQRLPQAKCGVNALIDVALKSTLFPVPSPEQIAV